MKLQNLNFSVECSEEYSLGSNFQNGDQADGPGDGDGDDDDSSSSDDDTSDWDDGPLNEQTEVETAGDH